MSILRDPELRRALLNFGDPEQVYITIDRDPHATPSRRWRWVIRVRGVQWKSGYEATPEDALEAARKVTYE